MLIIWQGEVLILLFWKKKSHLLLSSIYLPKWTLESLWNFHEIPLGLGKSINSVWKKNGILHCRLLSPLLGCFVWSSFKEVGLQTWSPSPFFSYICHPLCIIYQGYCFIPRHLKCFFISFNSLLRFIFIIVCVCVCISVYNVCGGAHGSQKRVF